VEVTQAVVKTFCCKIAPGTAVNSWYIYIYIHTLDALSLLAELANMSDVQPNVTGN